MSYQTQNNLFGLFQRVASLSEAARAQIKADHQAILRDYREFYYPANTRHARWTNPQLMARYCAARDRHPCNTPSALRRIYKDSLQMHELLAVLLKIRLRTPDPETPECYSDLDLQTKLTAVLTKAYGASNLDLKALCAKNAGWGYDWLSSAARAGHHYLDALKAKVQS